MPARKPLLGTHVDYHGTLDAINGLVPRDDQVITGPEITDLAESVSDNADLHDVLRADHDSLSAAHGALRTEHDALESAVGIITQTLAADDEALDTAQERLDEIKRIAGLIDIQTDFVGVYNTAKGI
jgi:hypothetical protein